MTINDIINKESQYELSLINVDYINFELSEIKKDGMVYLALDKDKIPKSFVEFNSDNLILENLSNVDYCYIVFNPLKNRCEELIVEQHAIVYKFDYISIMYFFEMLSVSEYERYKKIHNIFNENIMDWIKSKLRARMMNLSGDFIKDAIKEDTYFQVRKNNNSKDVYYIIYRWWEKGIDKDISFIDIINDGTLFVGEND